MVFSPLYLDQRPEMKKQPRKEISAEAFLRLNNKKGMTGKHNPDDTAFIPESGRFIREVRILRITGNRASVRFTDASGGAPFAFMAG